MDSVTTTIPTTEPGACCVTPTTAVGAYVSGSPAGTPERQTVSSGSSMAPTREEGTDAVSDERCGPWGSCAVMPGCPCGRLNWWQRLALPIHSWRMHRYDRKYRTPDS